jgi:hypothetical protein
MAPVALTLAPVVAPSLSSVSPGSARGEAPDTVASLQAALAEQGRVLAEIQVMLARLVAAVNGGSEARVGAVARLDPIGAGYTLSQRDLAERLGLPPSYISSLVRAFGLDEDPRLAVTVRSGSRRLVNYHPDVIERFRELLAAPPAGLDERAQHTVKQARSRLAEGTPAAA